MTPRTTLAASLAAMLAIACAVAPAPQPSSGHLRAEDLPAMAPEKIPRPVQQLAVPPKPKPAPKAETYSVVVKDVPVHELLFALARDAKLNVDIHPGIAGTVTLNAIDQTLPQLLTRLSRQVDLRFELDGPNLAVMPDRPHLRTYPVDYVNMARDTSATVAVSTQVTATGAGAGTAGGSAGGGSTSITRVENTAKNRFWDTLVQNIKDILQETDKEIVISRRTATAQEQTNRTAEASSTARGEGAAAAAGPGPAGQAVAGAGNQTAQARSGASQQDSLERDFKDYKTLLAASVIANPETGVISVRATSRQHEKIQEFLDRVLAAARRQVMIEATVAEVQLSDNYQQGIDWSRLRLDALGFRLVQTAVGNIAAPASALMEITYTNPDSRLGSITATAKLLESFGNVKVLSSPKLTVLNNQTAMLKVVDNAVYFTVQATTTQTQTSALTTFTTNLQTVAVGFVMNVTPQIGEGDAVLLNVRPSVSRIIGTVADPNPDLKKAGVVSEIPVIRTREMESLVRVQDGNIAVMGGLMEDMLDNRDNAVPGLHKLPLVGNLFTHRDDTRRKTELVIFLRPVVVRHAGIDGDFRGLRDQLPSKDFFAANGRLAPVPELGIGRTPR